MERILAVLQSFPVQLALIIAGALLFIPFLGQVHLFDWDEINFAESAREMLLTHNYKMVQINFQPFYEKPPLFIWLQAFSMYCFGVNEFAARLPNAICGIFTLLTVFNVGRSVFKSQFGVLWATLFAGSILPQIYFKSGIIDPVFNIFIFLSLYFLYKVSLFNDFEEASEMRRKRRRRLVYSAFFIGLAILTKGPVAILIVAVTVLIYFVIHRGKLQIEISQLLIWILIPAAMIITWLSFESEQSGFKFMAEFIRYQIRLFSTEDAGHGGPFYFHWLLLLIGVFPASALIFDAFKKNENDSPSQLYFKRWMVYLLFTVLIIFSIVKTKIVHYSSLCYFPITFLAAYYLNYYLDDKMKWTWRQTIPLLSIGLFIVAALTGGILVIQHPGIIAPYIKDDFAKQCLKAEVHWNNNDIFIGIIYLIFIVIAVCLFYTNSRKFAVGLLLISSALFINTAMGLIVPRVEKYSQAALIEFLESKKDKNCIVETAGFKSYAQYFYAARAAPSTADSTKVHYVVTKINKVNETLAANPGLEELYRKNGWVFYRER